MRELKCQNREFMRFKMSSNWFKESLFQFRFLGCKFLVLWRESWFDCNLIGGDDMSLLLLRLVGASSKRHLHCHCQIRSWDKELTNKIPVINYIKEWKWSKLSSFKNNRRNRYKISGKYVFPQPGQTHYHQADKMLPGSGSESSFVSDVLCRNLSVEYKV